VLWQQHLVSQRVVPRQLGGWRSGIRRRAENLYAPDWEGKSTGLRAGAEIAPTHFLRLILDGEAEWGADDWSAARLSASLRYGF
jgi:hypothetical protein